MACSSWLKTRIMLMCAIQLIILAALFFLATLVIAAVGIDHATESNTCLESNSSMKCALVMSLSLALNGSTLQQQLIVDGTDENEFVYWLVGATVCGIVFAFMATFGQCMLEYAMYRIKKHFPLDNTDGERGAEKLIMQELTPVGSGSATVSADTLPHHEDLSPSACIQARLNTLVSHSHVAIFKKKPVEFRKLTDSAGFSALIILFSSILLFILAVLSLLWATAVGYNHSGRVTVTLIPFMVVEILVGIIFPTLLFASAILIAIVLNYATYGAIDGREALPHILNKVKFKRGKDSDFWIIVDSFYFKLSRRKQPNERKQNETDEQEAVEHTDSCFPNSATWILIIISGLTIILVMSYFVDMTLVMKVTVNACNDSRINSDFSCFNASTLAFVNCVEDINARLLHCFKFYQFGIDLNIISSLAGAFAFYLAINTTISNIFQAMKLFLELYNTKLWSILFIIAGVLAFIGVTIVFFFWATGYISAFIGKLAHLNIINFSQLEIASLFIILVGILMWSSIWVEKTPTKDMKSGNE